MPKCKVIKIDEKEIIVNELSVKDLLSLFDESDPEKGIEGFLGQVDEFLPRATDAKLDELKQMAPSELKLLYDAFKEVNAVFFDVARFLGLGSLLTQIKSSLVKDFGGLFAGLLKPGTEMPSITDTPSF